MAKRNISITFGKHLCPNCHSRLQMEILSDEIIHIKEERIIKMDQDYSIEDEAEDNWRISLVRCLSCRCKLILENYFIEDTDEQQFYGEQIAEESGYIYDGGISSARNKLHILMPTSDIISKDQSHFIETLSCLAGKCLTNLSEFITEEEYVSSLKTFFDNIKDNIHKNETAIAFTILCQVLEAVMKHHLGNTGNEKKEYEKATLGKLIHTILKVDNESEDIEFSEREKNRKKDMNSLFYAFVGINEKYNEIKHKEFPLEVSYLSHEYLIECLLKFGQLVDFLKQESSTSINSSSNS